MAKLKKRTDIKNRDEFCARAVKRAGRSNERYLITDKILKEARNNILGEGTIRTSKKDKTNVL